ncbi:DUF2637 domain-containing protein [Rhodococcoides fascians]|uniref:DUF2637 domain-containing protein n=1 Tax=Rhodococcoides fascians TaxID=1828 RepID=UPI00068EFB52|nr:DUF2637 domain-containing protein [Rhodococcus fascians]
MTILTFHRRITSVHLSSATSILVGALAFWLTFVALTDLAVRTRVFPESQAWAWPLVVDGMIVGATIAASAIVGRARYYAWLLLVVASGMSIWANGIHAWIVSDGSPLAVTLAVTPPVFLLLSTHLTVILAGQSHTAESSESPVELGFDVPAPAVAAEPAPVLPEPDFGPVVLDPTAPGKQSAAARVASLPTIDDLMARQG